MSATRSGNGLKLCLIISVLLAAGCLGCRQPPRVKAGTTTPGVSPIATNSPESGMPLPQEYYGTAANCPVCGKEIQVSPYTPYEQCASSTTFFCCPQCKEQSGKK